MTTLTNDHGIENNVTQCIKEKHINYVSEGFSCSCHCVEITGACRPSIVNYSLLVHHHESKQNIGLKLNNTYLNVVCVSFQQWPAAVSSSITSRAAGCFFLNKRGQHKNSSWLTKVNQIKSKLWLNTVSPPARIERPLSSSRNIFWRTKPVFSEFT